MQTWTIADLIRCTGGTLLQGDNRQRVRAVRTDSRQVQAGDLFVALSGERFDGHHFVDTAVQKGAVAVMVSVLPERPLAAANVAQPAVICVPDTLLALQALAREQRRQFTGTVVAVTGSNGKTTVKEMTAAVLQRLWIAYRSPGNLNNHIGLPLALLQIPPETQVAVCEMGMNHLGEIRQLCAIAQPHIGVVTNIAFAHVGPVGSIDDVQQAKGELIEAIDKEGIAVLNADDPRVFALRRRTDGRVVTFGTGEAAMIRGCVRADHGLQGVACDLYLDDVWWSVLLPLPGVHNLMNALAAAAVGTVLGVPGGEIAEGLQTYRGMYGRLSVRQGRDDITLIDDTYNANPQSMQAALGLLAQVGTSGRRLAVLGDMLELGADGPEMHRQIGAFAGRCGIDELIVLGPLAQGIADGAHEAGMAESHIHYTTDRQGALEVLTHLLCPQDTVLIKGSRGMAMEHLVEALAVDKRSK